MSVIPFLSLVLAPAALLVAAFIVWPLLRRRAGGEAGPVADEARAVNRAVVAERRAQLDAELAGLAPDSPERARRIAEFSSAALADLGDTADATEPAGRTITADRADAAVRADAAHAAASPTSTPAGRGRGRLAWGLGLALLLVAAPLVGYRLVGTPEWPSIAAEMASGDRDVLRLTAELEKRMAERPDDPQGWLLLGRTKLALGDLPAARSALERALALDVADKATAAQIRVDLADVLARQDGAGIAGRPTSLVAEALRQDPRNAKGLALAGAFAASAGDAQAARRHWRQLLAQLPPGSEQARQVSQLIAQLPAAEAARIAGRVALDPALAGRVEPGDTLFVAVRGLSDDDRPVGPPLAVMRATAGDLPLAFSLDDSHAMAPTATLSSEPRVMVVARVSRSGAASASAGDIEGRSGPVSNNATGVEIRLDRVLP